MGQGLAGAVGVFLAGVLYNRVGPRILVTIGFVLVTASTFALAQLTVSTTGLSLQSWLVLRGLGLGFVNIPLQTLALSVISNKAMARGSSLINVTRQVFGAVGVAVLTTYFTQRATSHGNDVAAALHKTPLTGIAAICAPLLRNGIAQLKACVTPYVTTQGLADAFTVTMIGSVICIVLALFVGRDKAIEAAKRTVASGGTIEVSEPVMMAE
jgi:MFS family permease